MELSLLLTKMTAFISENEVAIIALSAAGSALAATLSIVISIAVTRSQLKHSRLTVRPIAEFAVGDYEDEIFISLSNKGVGPLFVDRLVIHSEAGERFTNIPLISILPPLPDGAAWKDFSSMSSGTVLSPQSSRDLIKLGIGPEYGINTEVANKLRLALGSLTIQCFYQDVYNRSLPPSSRELSWFKRRF